MSTWKLSHDIIVTTDPEAMDREQIFAYLHNTAYWCKGIPRDIVDQSLDNSLPFTLLVSSDFAGFGRLVTDYATFAYLGDVFVLEQYRGNGYGKFLVDCINSWLDDNRIRTSLLLTRDAQGLYAGKNWVHPESVTRVMRYKEADHDFYSTF